MSDVIDVVEIPADQPVVLAWEPDDPLAGATVVSVVTATSGGKQSYEHVQDEPATVWIVDHNFNRYPVAWSLFDQQGLLRDEYLVETPTVNRAIVRTDIPSAGRIRLI